MRKGLLPKGGSRSRDRCPPPWLQLHKAAALTDSVLGSWGVIDRSLQPLLTSDLTWAGAGLLPELRERSEAGGQGQGCWPGSSSVLHPPALLRREIEVAVVATAGVVSPDGSNWIRPWALGKGGPQPLSHSPKAVRGPRGRPRGWAGPLAPGLILF